MGHDRNVQDEHWTKDNMQIDKDTDTTYATERVRTGDAYTTDRTVVTDDDTALENEEGGGEAIGAGGAGAGDQAEEEAEEDPTLDPTRV